MRRSCMSTASPVITAPTMAPWTTPREAALRPSWPSRPRAETRTRKPRGKKGRGPSPPCTGTSAVPQRQRRPARPSAAVSPRVAATRRGLNAASVPPPEPARLAPLPFWRFWLALSVARSSFFFFFFLVLPPPPFPPSLPFPPPFRPHISYIAPLHSPPATVTSFGVSVVVVRERGRDG